MTDLFETMGWDGNRLPLKRVIIENYRNIKYKQVTFDEKGLVLSGKNGLGKTNIIEAIYWVLSGCLFNGTKQSYAMGITPVDGDQGIRTKVKLEWAVKPFDVEKVSYEKYDNDGDYKGTETAYYINGALEKRNKDAERLIREFLGIEDLNAHLGKTKLADIDVVGLLFNVGYVLSLDYKLLRGLVTDMVGDIDFEKIIHDNPTVYGRLTEPLERHGGSLERLKQASRAEKFGTKDKTGLQDELNAVETTIETLQKESEQAVDGIDTDDIKAQIKDLDDELDTLRMKSKQDITEATRDKKSEIERLKNDLYEEQDRIRKAHEKAVAELPTKALDEAIANLEKSISEKRNERLSVSEKVSEVETELAKAERSLSRLQGELKDLETRKQRLLDDWKKAKASGNNGEEITCPHCGQTFNLSQSKEHQAVLYKKIEDINVSGQKLQKEIELKQDEIKFAKDEITTITKRFNAESKKREALTTTIDNITTELNKKRTERKETASTTPVLDLNSKKVATIRTDMQRLTNEVSDIEITHATDIQKASTRITNIEQEKSALNQKLNADAIKASYLASADKSRDRAKAIRKSIIEVDDRLTLINKIEQEMFEKLHHKLKDTFGENITFNLYKTNIDGSIDTRVCEMLVKDKWGNYVNVKNVNTGLFPIRVVEFIGLVKKHYNIPTSFVFLDEIGNLDDEHITMLAESGEQIIATEGSNEPKITERSF